MELGGVGEAAHRRGQAGAQCAAEKRQPFSTGLAVVTVTMSAFVSLSLRAAVLLLLLCLLASLPSAHSALHTAARGTC